MINWPMTAIGQQKLLLAVNNVKLLMTASLLKEQPNQHTALTDYNIQWIDKVKLLAADFIMYVGVTILWLKPIAKQTINS